MLTRSKTTIVRYRFAAFVLDPAKRELQRDGEVLVVPARAFECLHYLIEHRNRAVGRDELVRVVFARANVSDAQLAQIVLRARRAIGDDGQEQRVIRTVPRFGFRWAAPVTVVEDESTTAMPAIDTPVRSDEARPPAPSMLAEPAPFVAEEVEVPAPPRQEIPRSATRHRALTFNRRLLVDCGVTLMAMLALALSTLPWPVEFELDGAQAQPGTRHAIIVLPMQVSGPNDAAWARLGMMDLVVDRMRRAHLPVLSSEATLSLLRSQDGGPDPQRLRRSTRAAWVVHGQVRNDKRHWQVTLTATDESGAVRRGLGNHPDLIIATRLAADRLLATIGNARPTGNDDASDLDERLQRAQSAILANELDTARRILLEAPEPERSAPQLEYRLAQVDFLAGRYLSGLATTNRLLRVDEARRRPLLRGQLLTLQGSLLMRLNRFPQAERSFDQAVEALAPEVDANTLGRALIGRGVAHSAQREFDAALADLGSARIQLLRAGDRLSVARVDGNLGAVEMERDRPLHAIQYYEKAERDFEAMGAVTELNGVRFMLAAAHLQLLQPAAALAVNERAWALRDQIRDPVQVADLIRVRAEALTAVGRLREARELLGLPESEPVAPGDFRRREYLLMDVARQSGDARSAVLLAGAALKDWPADKNPRLRAWVAFRQREAALEAAMHVSGQDTQLLEGDALASKLDAALRDRRAGHGAAAESHYREAEALAETGGIPGQIAHAVRAHARWLMENGRLDAAAALIGRVAPWAEQDFEVALLQVELYSRLRQPRQWHAALDHAQRLAGERPIPAGLKRVAPSGPSTNASASN